MSEYPRFLASELPLRPADECRFQVIPVPFEATVSYGGGTALGPEAILEASSQLEVWTGRAVPSRHGIYTWPAVDCTGQVEEVLDRIEQAVHTALVQGPQTEKYPVPKPEPMPETASGLSSGIAAKKPLLPPAKPVVPVVLGGEHTVSLGVLRALKNCYGSFGVIHFDAHADLRDSYEGTPYSHACVMRRAVQDLDLPLYQIGVRSLSPEEELYRRAQNIQHLDARTAQFPGFPSPFGLPDGFPGNVFLSFDVDALDSSLMPATGTPEPGGLLWWDALELVERSLKGRCCLGFDVVELAPAPSLHSPTYTAARLVHEIMGIIAPEPL